MRLFCSAFYVFCMDIFIASCFDKSISSCILYAAPFSYFLKLLPSWTSILILVCFVWVMLKSSGNRKLGCYILFHLWYPRVTFSLMAKNAWLLAGCISWLGRLISNWLWHSLLLHCAKWHTHCPWWSYCSLQGGMEEPLWIWGLQVGPTISAG